MNLENWQDIAREVGAIDKYGQESSSSEKSRAAIEILLGKDNLKKAVRYCVEHKVGSELLRGVLWQLHPYSAMEECYFIFKEERCIESKRDAIELLRVVADRRVLTWIPEFLAYDDEIVQNWAIGIIDQLVLSGLCDDDEVADILKSASLHPNDYVIGKAEEIVSRLKANKERNAIVQAHFMSKNT